MIKKSFFFIVLIMINSLLRAQDLSIKINFDKETYFKSEPIEAIVEFCNNSSHKISIEDFYIDCQPTQFETIITDEYGHGLTSVRSPVHIDPFKKFFIDFQPGESRYYIISVSYCYGQDFKNNISVYGHPSFNIGKYNIHVKFHTSSSEEDTTVKEYSSEIKQFSVVDPFNKEDEIVIDNIKTLCKRVLGYDKSGQLKTNLISLLEEYPNSNYAPTALRELVRISKNQKDDKVDSLILKFVEKYPDSYITLGILNRYMKDRNDFIVKNKLDDKLSSELKKYREFYKKENDKSIERLKKMHD